jgi:hypothetical protein
MNKQNILTLILTASKPKNLREVNLNINRGLDHTVHKKGSSTIMLLVLRPEKSRKGGGGLSAAKALPL